MLLFPLHVQLAVVLLLAPRNLSGSSTWQAGLPIPRNSIGVLALLSSQSCVAQGLSSEQVFLTPGHANGSLRLDYMRVLTV